MKYTVRFVFYYYDEFDTTLCNIYDVSVNSDNPLDAYNIADDIVLEKTKNYSNPGDTYFISLTDENGVIYVFSKNQMIVLPKDKYEDLPKSFCSNGQTFYTVDEKKEVKFRLPETK